MNEALLTIIAFVVLGVSVIIQMIFFFINKGKTSDPISHYLLIVSFLLLLINTTIRSMSINLIAVTNGYEAMIMFSQAILLITILYRFISDKKSFPIIIFGGSILSLLFIGVAISPVMSKGIIPPVPALQSPLFGLHVLCSFFGEGFFAFSFIASIYFLFVKDEIKRKLIDRIIYISIICGYFVFTAFALIFGAIWAEIAWGSYWSWDPKETCALITLLVYTIYLHLRLIRKSKGNLVAIVSIVGFLFAIFTFVGVNYLLPGLHSYL